MIDPHYAIGIVGYGTVGRGIHKLFEESVIAIYDTQEIEPITAGVISQDKKAFKYVDLITVSVPTPSKQDGSCDTSIVEETLEWIRGLDYKGIVLIKSAVVPSEIRRFVGKYDLRLVVSPEYMGESKYFTPYWKYPDPKDMKSHTWQIFGGAKEDTSECVDIFQRKMSVDTIFVQTDIVTASLCKYMENAFFATKVTFCNEFFDIAKNYGVDYNELRECWLADTRINRNHTMVFPKDRGYGGKCFPKDVRALIKDNERMGYSTDLLKAVDKTNEEIRDGKGSR